MNNDSVNNPFLVGKYLSDKYFCDRTNETAFLLKQIQNGRNVAIISPRRMGKSGLIHHFFNQPDIKEHYYVFYIDTYSTTSLAESAVKLLMKNDLVTQEDGVYRVYDYFFAEWLATVY